MVEFTKVADARLGLDGTTLTGDIGTGADATAVVASAGEAGVDRVVFGILLSRIFATNS